KTTQETSMTLDALQFCKKDGKSGDKKKGDDYCNNIGKTLLSAISRLPDFIDNAIMEAVAIINNNRGSCAVTTSLVKGEDLNTTAYGEFAVTFNNVVDQIVNLLNESDQKYARGAVKNFFPTLRTLIEGIPEVAVDGRVAQVIIGGEEGNIEAMNAINQALLTLRDALLARFKSYLSQLVTNIGSQRKDPDPDPDGSGMGAGSEIKIVY
ncbi:MAG: hypothetical protein PHD53_04620, partial [Methylococcales bacterium]|nr:hypothetical protein [Methylococcales bacterium]